MKNSDFIEEDGVDDVVEEEIKRRLRMEMVMKHLTVIRGPCRRRGKRQS